MIIVAATPDAEGLIRVPYTVKFLGCKIIDKVPTVWAVTDPLTKKGLKLTLVCKKDNESVTEELMMHYVTTLCEDGETYHLFEEPSKQVLEVK